MKNLLLLFAIPLLLSCAGTYKQASYTSNKVYIGMPIEEFKKSAGKKATIEAMESGYTVFKMNDYDLSAAVIDTKFFYFDSNGKLYKIDGGEFKQNRYQIEIIK